MNVLGILGIFVVLALFSGTASAANQSVNVAIVGSPGVINGGSLPTSGPDIVGMTFTNLLPANVNTANLANYDTVVLNVASSGMGCNVNTLTASAKADLVTFVSTGKKLIIYDSECSPQNYTWLPYQFTTANPGAQGASGTVTIVEENTLSTNAPGPYFIDAPWMSANIEIGDANVMTTFNANWCEDMAATNVLGITGPVHTYAKTGADVGLYLYNGFDTDNMGAGTNALRKIWVQELMQPFNPSNLPCGVTVVGITLTPASASNDVGTTHTVTATLKDLLGNEKPGVLVTFSVIAGPNNGTSGTCNPADCKSDASGIVTFTYTGVGGVGTDDIKACFTDQAGNPVCSQTVTKEWKVPPAGSISGMKFNDLNANGVKDAGDLGLAGWTIVLTDSLGNVVGTKVTDASGDYLFDPVPVGKYTLSENIQLGWKQTFPTTGFYAVEVKAGDKLVYDFGNVKIDGRMTGGGSVFTEDKKPIRVTHGFELHCDTSDTPNNLEVNWGKGNKFHLDTLKSAICYDDTKIEPNPPRAGFDTYVGSGVGSYNGVAGANAEWTFTDAGEPGKNDLASITIKDASNNVVLVVKGLLNNGNQQAHKE